MDGARFRLLGPVEVGVGNRLVDIGAARQRCVLAVLLLDANRCQSVDQLVERVWGGSRLPERPRKAAQIYVSLLRTALAGVDGVAIVRRPDGYLIELDERTVDVHVFHRLAAEARGNDDDDRAAALFERALGLWRGEPFGELDTPWLADVRDSLVQQRQAAERDLTDVQLRRGRHGLVLAQLSLWAQEHPLDERLAGQLMLALFRSGRQADALDVYRGLRGRLADELGTGPGHALHELHQRILTDDPSLSLPAGSVAIPRQLPAAPRWFTGRRAELDTLVGHPDTDGGVVVISAIDGMAGVGKTALAVLTAHRLATRYPDGQLFVDLHGHTQGFRPRTSADALDRLLRALGLPPERIPDDVEERAALYRQRLAGTRTLIVLDNAVDEAQVRPLLPGEHGCLVLVTSRRRLKGLDDAHALSLDVLPRSDALALVRTVAGRDDPLLAEITELCGRLPLALRIAAALLRHRPMWSVAQLAGLLRDQHQRVGVLSDGERDLGAVFALSYQSLDDARRRTFRLLGLVPGPDTDAHATAALLGTDPDTATRLLEDLVDHNLLVPHAPGRYRMHDLIRLHARAVRRRPGCRAGPAAGPLPAHGDQGGEPDHALPHRPGTRCRAVRSGRGVGVAAGRTGKSARGPPARRGPRPCRPDHRADRRGGHPVAGRRSVDRGDQPAHHGGGRGAAQRRPARVGSRVDPAGRRARRDGRFPWRGARSGDGAGPVPRPGRPARPGQRADQAGADPRVHRRPRRGDPRPARGPRPVLPPG
ncbi:MAG TPA: BTAD domain-containing putative transcriptional regulator [Pseudonocardiaceae bacterium]|nr:BTAD domain-containing putative transcriptional regulator [Pseudonocardiaceae bacterium]